MEPDWTTLADWISAFRATHDAARKGRLDAAAIERYHQDRDVLAKALVIAQRLSVKPGKIPRQALRVAVQLPLDLSIGAKTEHCVTVDLGSGGFATMLPKPLNVLERVGFTLQLHSTGRDVGGRARVVNVQKKGIAFRVAFTFEDLSPDDHESVRMEVFDAALATIPGR